MIAEEISLDDGNSQFGVCPYCCRNDGYFNVGKSHWFKCDEHRTTWCVGRNLFSSWRHETIDDQRRQYYANGFDKYEKVEPTCPPKIKTLPCVISVAHRPYVVKR